MECFFEILLNNLQLSCFFLIPQFFKQFRCFILLVDRFAYLCDLNYNRLIFEFVSEGKAACDVAQSDATPGNACLTVKVVFFQGTVYQHIRIVAQVTGLVDLQGIVLVCFDFQLEPQFTSYVRNRLRTDFLCYFICNFVVLQVTSHVKSQLRTCRLEELFLRLVASV